MTAGSLTPAGSLPGVHDLQRGQDVGQGLLLGQVAVQGQQDLGKRRTIWLGIACTADLVTGSRGVGVGRHACSGNESLGPVFKVTVGSLL